MNVLLVRLVDRDPCMYVSMFQQLFKKIKKKNCFLATPHGMWDLNSQTRYREIQLLKTSPSTPSWWFFYLLITVSRKK